MPLVWARAQQVVVGAAARVDGLGLEQGAHLAQRPAEVAVAPTVDRDVPAVGASRPMIMRMVVDLPEPLGPRNPVTWPGETSKTSWSTARVSP